MTTAVFADAYGTNIGFSKTFYGDGHEIEYKITGGWGMAPWGVTRVVRVEIHNTGTKDIENWMLAYDDFCGSIEHIWSGAVFAYTDSGLKYIKNHGWNAVIEPGGFAFFEYPLIDPTGAPGSIVMAQERTVRMSGFYVDVVVDNDWGTGFNGRFLLANETNSPVEYWELTVNTNIEINTVVNSWSAPTIESNNGTHTFKGTRLTNTHTIAPNSVMEIGFSGIKTDESTPEVFSTILSEVAVNPFTVYWTMYNANETQVSGDLRYSIFGSGVNRTVTISGLENDNFAGDVIVPSHISGAPVTIIGAGAFMGTAITSISLPETVHTISAFAFRDCVNLTEIIIPNSVKLIDQAAFFGCTSLAWATIGTSVTEIGMAAFGECTALAFIEIPNNVTTIGQYVFYRTGLESAVLGTGITRIPTMAFAESPYLVRENVVTLAANVSVSATAFRGAGLGSGNTGGNDNNEFDVENQLSIEAVYENGFVTVSWTSTEPDGKFELFYSSYADSEYQSLGVFENQFNFVHNTGINDFIIHYYKVVQTFDDDAIVSSSANCYVVWSPAGICWTEYMRPWDSDDINLSRINDNNEYYEFSAEFYAAGAPNLHFSAARSRFNNAFDNNSIIGIAPELIYRDNLAVETNVIEFKVTDDSVEVENLRIFKLFDDINMLLPIATNVDTVNSIVSAEIAEMGTYALVDMDVWLDMLDGDNVFLAMNWNELVLSSPLQKNGDNGSYGLTYWEQVNVEFLEQFWADTGIIPPEDGDYITNDLLPTLEYVLGLLPEVDSTDMSEYLDVVFLPAIANLMLESTAGDGVLDIDKLRILPEHADNCDNDKYSRLRGNCVHFDCKPGILERYYESGDLLYCESELDFYIDYNYYLSRLIDDKVQSGSLAGQSRYLGKTDSVTMNPFIEYTIESLFDELKNHSIEQAIYYEIVGNEITIHARISFLESINELACVVLAGWCESTKCDKDEYGEVIRHNRLRDLVIYSIEKNWSGDFKGSVYDFFPGIDVSVTVKIDDVTETGVPLLPNGRPFGSIPIYLYSEHCGRSNAASAHSSGRMRLYTKWCNKGRINNTEPGDCCFDGNVAINTVQYLQIAAHEFGHTMGLADYYPEGNRQHIPIRKNEIFDSSGMMSGNQVIVTNDIEMALYNQVWARRQDFIPHISGEGGELSIAIREKQIYMYGEQYFMWSSIDSEYKPLKFKWDCECCFDCRAIAFNDCTCQCRSIRCDLIGCRPRRLGDVNGNNEIDIMDSLEILIYLADMDGVVSKCFNAYIGALIVPRSRRTGNHRIDDALEILMFLAGIPSALDFWREL
jgi:hypothetical protein